MSSALVAQPAHGSRGRHGRIVRQLPGCQDFGSLCLFWPYLTYGETLEALVGTIGGEPIRVRGVVVVDVARRVHVPGVVRVATVGGAQARVLRYSLHPYLKPEVMLSVLAFVHQTTAMR